MTQRAAEKLCAFIVAKYGKRLTDRQLREPWTYIGGHDNVISGVVIDADNSAPGYRVMLEDVAAAPFTEAHAQEFAA